MSFDYSEQTPMPLSEATLSANFTAAMQRVYAWMFLGLLVTAGSAFLTISSPTLLGFVFRSNWTFFGLIGAELILVIAIGRVVSRVSPMLALALFFLYAALNGLTLSAIMFAYDFGTIVLAFGVSATLFGVMSVVGYTTKSDLTKWGGILFMGLVGLIIASVANFFLANSFLDAIITYAGVALFLGLTIYDTNRIKAMSYAASASGDAKAISQVGVMGALRLYLDFINLFLFILRLLGRRR